MNKRDYVRVSSLGSYFGVGFNDPEKQLRIDMGLEEEVFDDASKRRMNLGKILEDATLNFFEQELGVVITDRNTETISFYDGKLRGKLDGMTKMNGVDTVVENKVSSSKSERFTDDLNYRFQVQAYMLAKGVQQAVICGLYQGAPIYKIIQRDEDMIVDIKTMADFVVNVMTGLETFDNYPTHLMEKYSHKKPLAPLDGVTSDEKAMFARLVELKESIKKTEDEVASIESYIKEKFNTGRFEADTFRISITEGSRPGSYDIDAISIEYPNLDLSRFKKNDTTFKQIRITKKTPK